MYGYALNPLAALLFALVAGMFCVEAARRARWNAPIGDHLRWAAATVFALLGQRMVVELDSGLTLQFLSAAFLALLLGYPRALLSMALVAAVNLALPAPHAPIDLAALAEWGPRTLLGAVLPIWTMWLVVWCCRRWLPRNPFVFLLGCGLFGLVISYAAELGVSALVYVVLAPEVPSGFVDDFMPYALMLAIGEAWLEGMLTTLLVVYAPGSVRLFDEGFYLGA